MDINEKAAGRHLVNKVPQVTFFFWIIKVLCTTVGETFADFLNVNLNLGLTGTSVAMGILLVIALFFQFKVKRYVPAIYWVTVVFISVFGTLVTDNLTDKMNIPLEISTIVFSILLLLTFAIWYAKEKTLSIHSISTPTREFFYWATILFTFALGTAAGDLMAESLGLGYLVTGIIVSAVIVLTLIARHFKLNAVLSFWIVYVMTRPLGASIGDLLSQPTKFGGLGLGATTTSALFLAGILGIILYFTFSKRDVIPNTIAEDEGKESRGLIMQTIITVTVFITVGMAAYFWRQNMLQKETAKTVPTDSAFKDTKLSPLGDLSVFTKIVVDTRDLVIAGKLTEASTRISDLEFEWDKAQSRLKPLNGAKWAEVDNAIDKVLRNLRSVNPNQRECKSSLDALLIALK